MQVLPSSRRRLMLMSRLDYSFIFHIRTCYCELIIGPSDMWMACHLCVLLHELVMWVLNFYSYVACCVFAYVVLCMKHLWVSHSYLFEQTTDASPSRKPQPQQHHPGNATNDECANPAYANDDNVHPKPE